MQRALNHEVQKVLNQTLDVLGMLDERGSCVEPNYHPG
jgi:hypothetical protein